MAETSNIGWTDATVNFWWGCTKVGPGCDWCYAETWAKRTGGDLWGAGVPRRWIKSAVKLIHKLDNDYAWWAADAAIGQLHPNQRRRVFIQSMSDLFDNEVPIDWLAEAWCHIAACDRIDIQIVTKRVSIVEKRLASIGVGIWPLHAGLIISVVNQDEFDRDVPRLRALKRALRIPWIGLSMEPLLGRVEGDLSGLDWAIVGMESGAHARHQPNEYAQAIVDQCADASVPVFVKQLSSGRARPITDIDLFPEGLRVRQFPEQAA
jgi:protein gp37